MSFTRLIAAAGLCLALIASGLAQTTQPPAGSSEGAQGQYREREGRRGDRRFGGKLNLTTDQKAQMKAMQESNRSQMQAIRNDTSLTEEQKRTKMKELRQSSRSQFESVLTPEQREQAAKFKQERKGRQGGRGPGQLNLTDDQKAKMRTIHEGTRSQMEAIRNDSTLSEEQKGAKIKELHASTKTQAQAILTPEQREQMAKFKQERKGRRRGGEMGRPNKP